MENYKKLKIKLTGEKIIASPPPKVKYYFAEEDPVVPTTDKKAGVNFGSIAVQAME